MKNLINNIKDLICDFIALMLGFLGATILTVIIAVCGIMATIITVTIIYWILNLF